MFRKKKKNKSRDRDEIMLQVQYDADLSTFKAPIIQYNTTKNRFNATYSNNSEIDKNVK